MRTPDRRPAAALLAVLAVLAGALLAACAAGALPDGFAAAAAEAPEDQPARLWLDGDTVVGASAAVGPGAIPRAARTTIEAIAPGGNVTFAGREWGPRGEGFRVEKVYADGTGEQVRSTLVAEDGRVLERSHSVPLPEVPAPVLDTAMTFGRDVLRAEIVSGPEREEGWRCTVKDRIGRTYVVATTLQGGLASAARLVAASTAVTGAAPTSGR